MNLGSLRAVFEVTSPDDRPLYFELGDEEYASSGEVRSPDGAIHEVYPGSFAVVRGGPGRYLVFVTSYYPVQVTLTVDTAEETEVGLGATATGTLDRDRGIALYRVQAPGGVPLLAEVTSDDTLDTMLSLVSTEDAAVTLVDFAGPGEPEQVIVPAGTTGSLLFTVTTFEGSFGHANSRFGRRPSRRSQSETRCRATSSPAS